MKIFFDTSSFVKRFVEEIGSKEADDLCQKASELGLSIICFPEIVSALNRKLRSEIITKEIYLDLKGEVLEDIVDADIINLTPKEKTERTLIPPQSIMMNLLLLGTVIILPGLALLGGILVFVQRRRRG